MSESEEAKKGELISRARAVRQNMADSKRKIERMMGSYGGNQPSLTDLYHHQKVIEDSTLELDGLDAELGELVGDVVEVHDVPMMLKRQDGLPDEGDRDRRKSDK